MKQRSYPLSSCSTKSSCWRLGHNHETTQMFPVASPPVEGRENTKHWSPLFLTHVLMPHQRPVVNCAFPDCQWVRQFLTPKPNPDAEVQAVTTRPEGTWPFMQKPLRQTTVCFSAWLYNLKPAANHMFIDEHVIIGRGAAGHRASQAHYRVSQRMEMTEAQETK